MKLNMCFALCNALNVDKETQIRGLAWTLWKALIIAAGLVESNSVEAKKAWEIIDIIIREYLLYK